MWSISHGEQTHFCWCDIQVPEPNYWLFLIQFANIFCKMEVPFVLCLQRLLEVLSYLKLLQDNLLTLSSVPALVTYVPMTYVCSNSRVIIRPLTASGSG